MSITRTAPYGTVTDDSGAGTDGTVANNAWLQGLLDLIDARWSRTTTTSTGTQTVINPSQADLLICNNATDLTIRSITAPSSPAKPGKALRIVVTGAGNVFLNHQDTTGTTAANRLINCATSGATPLSTGGSATYVYDDANSRWRLISHEQGAWITPTFAAGNFTATAPTTWTVASGDVTTCAYRLVGRTLQVAVELVTTTVASTSSVTLKVGNGAWGSFTATKGMLGGAGLLSDNAASTTGYWQVAASGTVIDTVRTNAAAWANATDATAIYFVASFEVN